MKYSLLIIFLMAAQGVVCQVDSTYQKVEYFNYNYTCSGCPDNGTSYSILETSSSITVDDTYDIYIFTGSTETTWTLSSIASLSKVLFFIENAGTARLNINGTDDILNSKPFRVMPGIGYTAIKSSSKWILQ